MISDSPSILLDVKTGQKALYIGGGGSRPIYSTKWAGPKLRHFVYFKKQLSNLCFFKSENLKSMEHLL